jgi:flagellar assembly protein FliH
MASVEKFLFDIAFDDELQKAAGAAHDPNRRRSFSADDLAGAKDQGFAAGRTAGLEEAARSTDQAVSEALAVIAKRLEELLAQLAQTGEEREGQAIETAVLLLAKLFPELARRNALGEVVALITQCLEELREEPRVVIRTADALLDPLRDRLDSLTAGAAYDGKVVLLADEALAPSDVRVEWADGGAERDTGRLWAEIDQVLERNLGQCRLGPQAPHAVAPETAAPAPPEAPTAPAAKSDATGREQDGLMTPELEHE